MRAQRWLSLQAIARSKWGLPLLVVALAAGSTAPEYCLAQTGGATTATWVPTGDLNVPRAGHTATLLRDGRVLVVGGSSPESVLDSTELYDQATGAWTLAGRLHFPRDGHSATLLADGRVLVVGGCYGVGYPDGSVVVEADCSTPELFDPATGTWSQAGRTSKPVFFGTATGLHNGEVLVVGGVQADATYDPVTDTWKSVAGNCGEIFMGRPFSGALLADGQVLFAGGGDAFMGLPFSSTRFYDPVARWCYYEGSLSIARTGHTVTTLNDGRVLAAGGWSFANSLAIPTDLWDPTTRTWTPAGSLNIGRTHHTATLLASGEVLVAGGYIGNPISPGELYRREFQDWLGAPASTGNPISDAEVYDPNTRAWRRTASLGIARDRHTATLLADGRVLVAGGQGPKQAAILRSSELYEHGYSPVPIVAAFTGSWYNPAQNGHGFALEVLPGRPMQLLASWFMFAPEGGQAWIVGLGPINGNRAVLQGSQSAGSGGRFPPNFDATYVHQQDWGTLTFTFSDCNHGRVDWVSSEPGYGSGGMDLTRLTLPAGLTCSGSGAALK